jgi:hypothetical protein
MHLDFRTKRTYLALAHLGRSRGSRSLSPPGTHKPMKRFFVLLVLCLVSRPIDAAMVRVARVVDSRTIVLDGGATVTLRGVDVPPDHEELAAEYLRSLLANHAWVLAENGDVYRSPDALYVNAQLIERVYLTGPRMRYLGEAMPGTRRAGVSPAGPAPSRRRPGAAAKTPPRQPPGRRRAQPSGFVPRKGGV